MASFKGAISFGRVYIPISLNVSVKEDDKIVIKCNYTTRKADNTDLDVLLDKETTKTEKPKIFNKTELKDIDVEIKA